jgi:ABC-type Na+ efflux pump permease subunit
MSQEVVAMLGRIAFLPLSRLELMTGRAVPMKLMTAIGMGLIVIGVVALIYQGITYTTREKVLDVGPLEVTAERRKTIPLPPVLGGLALAGGIVLVVVGSRPS